MDATHWDKLGELFEQAAEAELTLFAFVSIPVDSDDTQPDPTPEAHLVWAKTPREARLMVCFPGGHFINILTGAAIVTLESTDILSSRTPEDIAMLEHNLQAMVSQAAMDA